METMNYTNNQKSYSRMASKDEIMSSLYKISVGEKNPQYGGIPLFADENAVYVEHNDKHTLVYGLTGSKKTRLIGMPALKTYAMSGESFIANDPKGELYDKTFPLLKERGYNTIVINLRDPLKSNAWNPLKIPYTQYKNDQKDKAIESVMDMSMCISQNGYSKDPYWENSAASLLAGLIMVLFEYAPDTTIHFKSLRAVRSIAFKIEHNDVPFIRSHFLQEVDKSSFLYSLLLGTADVTESTRSCIISVFDQALLPFFCQDNLIDMLSDSDFEFGSIGTAKTAVFLVTPDENTVYNKLVSVFVKQCYAELLREAEKHPGKKLPLRVNFLLDEFANLPSITDFQAMITASRSRNIRFNLFIQSKTQLAERYGINANTIQGNCENWIFLHSREISLLDEISALSGLKNNHEPLVTPTMLQTLDKDKGEAFVMNKRLHPYIANLWDIDQYPHNVTEETTVIYPENSKKADKIFDFQELCYMSFGKNPQPVFSSTLPADNKKPIFDDDEDNEDTDNQDDLEDNKANSVSEFTLDQYGSSVGNGWHGLLSPILDEINRYNKVNQDNEIIIDQIKQKWGTLNMYVSGAPDYIRGMIDIAEHESAHICETCGARGQTVNINGWYSTLCPRHAQAEKVANHNRDLESKLYRKFMDTYERGKWSSRYNLTIKRLLFKNWFMTTIKEDGEKRIIKMKRERHKTYLLVKYGNKLIKHDLYVQWSENTDKSLHEGYWHIMKGNDIAEFGFLEQKSAEIEAAKKIYHSWNNKYPMELIRMVSFEEGLSYPQCVVQNNFNDYWNFVKHYLVKNAVKMTGAEHLQYGVPLIENNGTVYAFILPYHTWGKLMAEAFTPDNTHKSAFKTWEFERPEGETSWINPHR